MNPNMMDIAYEMVAHELARQDLKPGIMARSAAEAMGDDKIAKSLYLKYRAEQICADLKERAQKDAEIKRQAKERTYQSSDHLGPATSGQKALGWTITVIAAIFALGIFTLMMMGEI